MAKDTNLKIYLVEYEYCPSSPATSVVIAYNDSSVQVRAAVQQRFI